MGTPAVPVTSESLNHVASAGQDFKSKVQDDLKSKMQVAEKDFQRMTRNAGERVGAMASELQDSATEYVETGRRYVRQNPGQSVAIAAAAGVVAGSLLTLVLSRRRS